MKGGPQAGEEFVEQILRQSREATSSSRVADPLKRHFWILQLLDCSERSSYDVVVLPRLNLATCSDASSTPDTQAHDCNIITSIVMVQPDLSLSDDGPRTNYPSRWFLLEYVLL